MITFATASGCESIATWLDAMVVVFALMSLAKLPLAIRVDHAVVARDDVPARPVFLRRW